MRHAAWPAMMVLSLMALAPGEAVGGLGNWAPFWSRDANAGRAVLDSDVPGGRPPVIRIEHTGRHDWSLGRTDRIPVQPGDRFVLSGRVKVQGEGDATLAVILYGQDGEVLDWAYGGRTAHAADDWQTLRSRFVVPFGARAILPRLIGSGPATVWFDSFRIERAGRVESMRDRGEPPPPITVETDRLAVTLAPPHGLLTVVEKPGGRRWTQRARPGGIVVVGAEAKDRGMAFTWLDPRSGLEGTGEIALDAAGPEFTVTLSADGDLRSPLRYPHPFTAEALAAKDETPSGRQPPYLVIPMNEGISYPVDDETIRPRRLIAYGGHGICMGFWGVTDGEAGQMAIIETADDAAIRIDRAVGLLCVRAHLAGNLEPDREGVLQIRDFIGSRYPDYTSVERFVGSLYDPPGRIERLCREDLLRRLLAHADEKGSDEQPTGPGLTVPGFLAWPEKRRFYSAETVRDAVLAWESEGLVETLADRFRLRPDRVDEARSLMR